ncbi:hypothetical protein BKA62DRAFT_766012 [Auriculariales sp. MPI-PUGE-AT-0066]|nr:hypothetical protein BKA62DRAFT_766012 [Auriculariales sp. MPI-PUGE-AT-0066]
MLHPATSVSSLVVALFGVVGVLGSESSEPDTLKYSRLVRRSGDKSYGYSWGSWDDDEAVLSSKTQLVIAICVVGLALLTTVVALIVCCKNRKKFYRPLAAYYRGGGPPPHTAYNVHNPVTVTKGHYPSQSHEFNQPLLAKA